MDNDSLACGTDAGAAAAPNPASNPRNDDICLRKLLVRGALCKLRQRHLHSRMRKLRRRPHIRRPRGWSGTALRLWTLPRCHQDATQHRDPNHRTSGENGPGGRGATRGVGYSGGGHDIWL